MLVTTGMPGEYQVKLLKREEGIFSIIMSETSFAFPSLDWLISSYERTLRPGKII